MINKKQGMVIPIISIVINVITILMVIGLCIILYIGFNQNQDVQNLSQLFDRLFSKGIEIPLKKNSTGPIGDFLPNIRSLREEDHTIFDTLSHLKPNKNPILLDDDHGASLEELETSRIPYYGDFELNHPKVPYNVFNIK